MLENSDFKTPDSKLYIYLSKNLTNSYIQRNSTFLEESFLILPGYPVFLKIFAQNYILVIITQIILHIFISIIILIIAQKLFPLISKKLSILIIILTQIETTLFTYSYRILSELLFSFFVALLALFIVTYMKSKKRKIEISIYILIVSICVVRPTAIFLVAIFVASALLTHHKMFFIRLSIVTILFISVYSSYNYVTGGIYTYTTLQNTYLLFYEGAGSKAISTSTSLQNVQSQESARKTLKIGINPPLKESDQYNFDRGIDLVMQNKRSFVILHSYGMVKMLFGPNIYELIQIFSDSGRIKIVNELKFPILIVTLIFTVLVSLSGLVGSMVYFRNSFEFRVLFIIILVFLIGSSGPQTYGRFRAPISAFLAFFAVLIFNKTWLYFQSKNYHK